MLVDVYSVSTPSTKEMQPVIPQVLRDLMLVPAHRCPSAMDGFRGKMVAEMTRDIEGVCSSLKRMVELGTSCDIITRFNCCTTVCGVRVVVVDCLTIHHGGQFFFNLKIKLKI